MDVLTITITNGALCMDGGSIFLEATDHAGRDRRISLDWSIKAKQAGSTSLAIDGRKIEQGSAEEAEWIEALRTARIAGTANVAPDQSSVANRIVLAPDVENYLAVIDRGPQYALMELRDDMLKKLQSQLHSKGPASINDISRFPERPPQKSRFLPLP